MVIVMRARRTLACGLPGYPPDAERTTRSHTGSVAQVSRAGPTR